MCEGDKLLNREPESEVKENWLKATKISWEILDDLGAEGSIEQMISDIDNGRIWEILRYHLTENWRSREEIKKEVLIYYKDIEPRLGDEKLNTLFNILITKKRILPSWILEEFKIRDKILAEPDPKVKELMEISLKHDKFPSLVLNGKELYKKFAEVEDRESRNIILYYLEEWLSPRLVNDEYEDYLDISRYEYKNEDLKNFILSLIDKRKVKPSLVALFFDIFKDWTEFKDDKDGHNEKKDYIVSLFNTRWL